MSNFLSTMKPCLLLAVLVGTSHAFSTTQPLLLRPSSAAAAATSTSLYGSKRRGRLANNVSTDEDGIVKIISNKRKQKLGNAKGSNNNRGKNKKGGNGGDDDVAISPLLAEWAKEDSNGDGGVVSTSTTTASTSAATTASDVFVSFDDDESSGSGMKGKNKNRKNKNKNKSGRAILSAEQIDQMDELLEGILEKLQTTNCDVNDLVSNIASLVDMGTSFSNDQLLLPTLKSILSARPLKDEKQPSYRLAWVGSDDAVCHVGTSLHKVPLARLQEIYLLLGFNRWELLEVIRILGPFPNVRNTLKGDIKLKKLGGGGGGSGIGGSSEKREGVRMEVAYNSMIDGTGKEILAGKDDNVKYVNLDVWFANEKAIVCTTVSDGEDGGDPLSGDGSKILFFTAEENLDEELEKLRAA